MHKLLSATALALALGAAGAAFAQGAGSGAGTADTGAATAETVRRSDSGGSSASPSATTTGRETTSGTSAEKPPIRSSDPSAAAPGSTRSSAAAAAGSGAAANVMMGMKAQELIGRDVVNAVGKEVGEIDDIVVNDQDQAIYAVVGVGGFLGLGEKDVAIPFNQLRLGADNVILMSEKGEGQLKEMPAYKKGQWKSLERNKAIEPR